MMCHSCYTIPCITCKQGSFFQDNHFEYQQPYVIFRIECFVPSHNSIPSGQIWKIPSQTGVIFSRCLHYLHSWMFCPTTLYQVIRLQKILHKVVLFFEDNHFEYQQPYVIFKIECFIPKLHSKWSDLKNFLINRG